MSIAREHMATDVTASMMADLAARAPRRERTGQRVLVACVEGELHDLGARMVAELLELDGFTVRFLGANLPTDSLVTMIQEERPHVVVLSVFVGGQALAGGPDVARQLDVELVAHDARAILQVSRLGW